MGVAATAAPSRGIDMPKSRKEKPAVPPLTSSVQENFRGFTYHGGESIVPAGAGILKADGDEQAVQDEEFSPHDEDEDEGLVGRYASRRRGEDMIDGFDEDLSHV